MSRAKISQHLLILITLLFICSKGYSQLSDLHYLPPLKQGSNNSSVKQQAIYLSTPETTAFTVNMFLGNSITPLATYSLINTTPIIYNLANGDNDITLVQNSHTGIVLNDAGLRFESANGEGFYVNYRGSSASQSTSLTSKGRKAMGTAFKWGGVPNYGTTSEISTSLGMMATEDNTVVTISDYDTDCEFRIGTDRGGNTADTFTVTLNTGESYVIEAYTNQTPANIDGWLGATIAADKPIVISNGGLNYGAVSGSGKSRDAGIDQPVPEDNIGKEYVFVRGGGLDTTEFIVIIATNNNTKIYVNGATTEVANINNGEYFIVDASYYSNTSPGANMYVRTSKDAYAYQNMAGSTGIQTVGLNFVAPLNCLIPDTVDNIPNITDAAGTSLTGGITIIASTTTADANIIVTDGSGIVTKPASSAVAGNTDWKTFYIDNLTGNVDIQSTGPVAVGFFGANNNRGIAGYFSGFDLLPIVNLEITGILCLPGAALEVKDETFDAYQWYYEGNAITGATNATYNPTLAGDYYVKVTKGTCSYDSNNLGAYYCDPDIELIKTASSTTVNEGDTITFTITAQNFAIDPATNLVVTDALPAGLTLVSASPSVGSWSAPNWNVGSLTSGSLETLTIVAQADTNDSYISTQSLVNTASNTQDQTDTNTTSDSPSVSFTILNDYDNDGVMDINDLDDDNDGVLDLVENNITYRFNVGGAAYTDARGRIWSAETNITGGSVSTDNGTHTNLNTGNEIGSTTDDIIYDTYRNAGKTGTITYSLPVADGTYKVVFHWADCFGNAANRKIDIDLEGNNAITSYTPVNDFGSCVAGTKDFDTTVTDGILNITYSGSGWPILHGLEVFNYDTDSDGTPNQFDLDSDDDGCSDSNEAHTDADADGGDGGAYGVGTPIVNIDGTVIGMVYATPADNDNNSVFDFLEVATALTITTQPTDQPITLGTDASFTITAIGAGIYQWQVSTDGGTNFNDITDGTEYSGALTNTLTVINPKLDKNGFVYRVALLSNTSICDTILSAGALITIGPKNILTNRKITTRVNKN